MLYRFEIELSNIDDGIYEKLDFRISQHPSETETYLVTRVLAYILSYQENLEFTPQGLGDPDAPAIRSIAANGAFDLWVEIGNPSAKRLHKASKSADKVIVYTYKNVEVLLTEMRTNEIHRVNDIDIYAFDSEFLTELEHKLQKNNRWSFMLQQGQIDVTISDISISTELKKYSLRK